MKHIMILKNDQEHLKFKKSIQDILHENQIDVLISSSLQESKDHLESLNEPYRIYIVGGDGTMNQLIDYFVYTDHELVTIPLGTGNDFNRTVGISKDPIEVLKASLTKSSQKIDIIQINDTYSINVACFGLDSTIANHIHDETSLPIPKKMGYIIGILKYIFRYHGYQVCFKVNDQILYEGKITLFALGNASYYGGGFCVVPEAKVDDGKMHVRIVDYLPLIRVPYLFYLLLKKRLDNQKEVHDFIVDECEITSDNPCNKDGEEYNAEKYQFKVLPNAVNVVFTK